MPTMRRTLKRFEFGCAMREAWMLCRPLMRSPDCGSAAGRAAKRRFRPPQAGVLSGQNQPLAPSGRTLRRGSERICSAALKNAILVTNRRRSRVFLAPKARFASHAKQKASFGLFATH